ncbi:hypothetical protein AKJ16_DCAP15963 [Drosera capensis]
MDPEASQQQLATNAFQIYIEVTKPQKERVYNIESDVNGGEPRSTCQAEAGTDMPRFPLVPDDIPALWSNDIPDYPNLSLFKSAMEFILFTTDIFRRKVSQCNGSCTTGYVLPIIDRSEETLESAFFPNSSRLVVL